MPEIRSKPLINIRGHVKGRVDMREFRANTRDYMAGCMKLLMCRSLLFAACTCMIAFLAGLQAIPKSLYEAAEVDGAGSLVFSDGIK